VDASDGTVPWPLQEQGTVWGWSGSGAGSDDWSTSLLPEPLLEEMRRLDPGGVGPELTEVFAACLRLREPALLSIGLDDWVWPITLYPALGLYRGPIDWSKAVPTGLLRARLLDCEPALIAPPPGQGERWSPPPCHYRLDELSWTLALHGPRSGLLGALTGPVRFRAADAPGRRLTGALGSAAARLRDTAASLTEIAQWPGLDVSRASRLLNGLYMDSRLIVREARQWRLDEQAAWSDTVPSRWPYRA